MKKSRIDEILEKMNKMTATEEEVDELNQYVTELFETMNDDWYLVPIDDFLSLIVDYRRKAFA